MRVHVLQHVPFEGLGSIEPWLVQRDTEIRYTRLFERDPLPDLDAVDLLVAMGGPMSVNDEAQFSWLEPEKRTVREAIEREIRVLGICLGAQLIASALGSRVYPNAVKEIGWWPIQGGIQGTEEAFRFPSQCTVFHWHGETFDLPGARCGSPGAPDVRTRRSSWHGTSSASSSTSRRRRPWHTGWWRTAVRSW